MRTETGRPRTTPQSTKPKGFLSLWRNVWRDKLLNYIVDVIPIFLISFAMFLSYISVSYWELAVSDCIWLVVLPIAILTLLSLKWWVTPSVVVITVVSIAIKAYYNGEWFIELTNYIRSFAKWIFIDGAPYSEEMHKNGSELLLFALVAFLITTLMFMIIRYVFSAILAAAVPTALIVMLLIWREVDVTFCILMALAGLVMLLPRIYINIYDRKKRKQIKRNKYAPKPYIAPRSYSQLIVIPLALVIVLFAQAFIPENTSEWKSQSLNFFVSDISNMLDPFSRGGSSNFSLKKVGFQNETGKLGGPISPSEDRVLEVYTLDRPVLLKGAVYDEYTGESWRVSENDGDFRYEGMGTDEYKELALGNTPDLQGTSVKALYESLIETVEMEVKYLNGNHSALFTPGFNISYDFKNNALNRQVFFNLRSEMYSHSRFSAHTKVNLKANVWKDRGIGIETAEASTVYFRGEDEVDMVVGYYEDGFPRTISSHQHESGNFTNVEIVDENGVLTNFYRVEDEWTMYPTRTEEQREFFRLETLTVEPQDEKYQQFLEKYTQLPESFPQSVRDLAQNVTGLATLPMHKAFILEQYLALTANYTLEPEVPPEGVDFVEHFLNTKEGYCVYYASAMTTMARALGIPARYVTGFGLVKQERQSWEEDKHIYYAKNSTAHAWAELYFEGIGWLEFDPLNWNSAVPADGGVSLQMQNNDGESETLEPVVTPSPTPEPDAEETEANTSSDEDEEKKSPLPIILVIAVVVLLIAAFVWRIAIKRRGRRAIEDVNSSIAARFNACYKDITQQLRAVGSTPNNGETLTAYAKRVDWRFTSDKVDFASVVAVKERLLFGGIEPTEQELERALECHEQLEAEIKERLGGIKYFVKRKL